MFSGDDVFPLICEPNLDESGLGYCLRSASRNGSNLYAVRRMLGVPDGKSFTQTHSKLLARLFQSDIGWLQRTLPPDSFAVTYDWYGHRWSTIYQQRRRPQVCPHCVHQRGYVKAIWDIGACVLCLEHACMLVDHCAKCGQRLRWDRPALDVGHCGHIVAVPTGQTSPNGEETAFQLELERRFNQSAMAEDRLFSEEITNGIGLDGWLAIVLAIGIKERAHQVHRRFARERATSEWSGIANRAIDRAKLLDGATPAVLPEFATLVAEAPLIRIARYASLWHDSNVVLRLLRRIFGDKVADHSGLQLHRENQLELF